jgi:hypothetical protein
MPAQNIRIYRGIQTMKAPFQMFFFSLLLAASGAALAFNCPAKFDAAQAKIDQVSADMKGMESTVDKQEMALVHALLDDAKMLLAGAHHNHEKPQGKYDHARSMAKADAALGYAEAAEVLSQRYMQK